MLICICLFCFALLTRRSNIMIWTCLLTQVWYHHETKTFGSDGIHHQILLFPSHPHLQTHWSLPPCVMGNSKKTKKVSMWKVHILRYNILRIDIPCCLFKQKPNKYLYHKATAPYSSGKPPNTGCLKRQKLVVSLKQATLKNKNGRFSTSNAYIIVYPFRKGSWTRLFHKILNVWNFTKKGWSFFST